MNQFMQANALDELRGIINYMNQSGVTLPPAMAAACAAAASLPTLQQQTTQIASGSSDTGSSSCSGDTDSGNVPPSIDTSTQSDVKPVATDLSPINGLSDSVKVISRSMSDKRPLKVMLDMFNADSADQMLATFNRRKKVKLDPESNRSTNRSAPTLSLASSASTLNPLPMTSVSSNDRYSTHSLLTKSHL